MEHWVIMFPRTFCWIMCSTKPQIYFESKIFLHPMNTEEEKWGISPEKLLLFFFKATEDQKSSEKKKQIKTKSNPKPYHKTKHQNLILHASCIIKGKKIFTGKKNAHTHKKKQGWTTFQQKHGARLHRESRQAWGLLELQLSFLVEKSFILGVFGGWWGRAVSMSHISNISLVQSNPRISL